MIRSPRARGVLAFLLSTQLAIGALPLAGQSLVYGALAGTVRDSAGIPIADALVEVRDRIAGTSRAFVTGRDGMFRAAFLTPSSYDVRVEALGYRPRLHQAVAVRSSASSTLAIQLRSAAPPVIAVDTVRAGGVRPRPMAWLAERGYAELAGRRRLVADVSALSVVADDRGVEGLAWRSADASVDGAMLGATGLGARTGLVSVAAANPLSAVGQAAVGGLDWDSEIGGSGVGVAALSRRGGDVTSRAWNLYGGSSDVGASFRLDGPLQRDTAYVALGVDYQRSELWRPAVVAAGDAEGLAVLQSARDDHATSLDALAVETPFAAERASAFARLDWDVSDRYAISVRGSGSFVRSEEPLARSLGFGGETEATALQASLNVRTRLTDRLSSELRFSGDVFDGAAASPLVPATLFAGRGIGVGGEIGEPFADRRLTPRLNALFHWDLGRHRLKIGALMASHRFETEGGSDAPGAFRFGDASDLAALSGTYRAITGPLRSGNFRMRETAFVLQDAWQVAEGFDLLLGLRVDAQRLPVGQLTTDAGWLAASGLDNGRVDGSRTAVAPRVGLRWELGAARRWTIEGGAGVFHDLPDHVQFGEALSLSASRPVRAGAGTLSSWPAAPDPASAPLQGNTLTMLGPGFEGPRTRRMQLHVIRGTGGWVTWVGGIYRYTDYLARRSDINLPFAPTGTDQYGRALHGELMQLGTLIAATPGSNRRFGGFDAVHAIEVTGFSEYRAAVIGVERVFDAGLSLGLQYAYSRTTDNLVDGSRAPRGPVAGSELAWADATSDLDAPHRALAAVEWSLRPAGATRVGLVYHLSSGAPFTPGFRDGVDANGDGIASSDAAFVDAALPGMDALIAEWDCLSRDAGMFARRNGCRGELIHRLDVRFAVRIRELAGGPLELIVDALDVTAGARPLVDRALLLVDRTGTLTTDALSGVTTVPLVVNPNFGGALAERSPGTLFRVGLRFGR